MREQEKLGITPTEIEFIRQAEMAGLIVVESPRIYCQKPVASSHSGKTIKSTLPDCVAIDPYLPNFTYVEVTDGNKSTGHKKAQRRVIKAAKVQNYVVVTENELSRLISYEEPELKLAYLYNLFGWNDAE